jgi:hypothetical protein
MTRESGYYFGYQPDSGECALMIAQEKEITSLRSDYHEANKGLRNFQGYTDRQLRGLSKEKRFAKRFLASVHHFDVVNDSFEVEISEDVYVMIPYDTESICNEDDYKGTRKDKRRAKTMRRKYERVRRILASKREKSALSLVVRKTGALPPVVAA